MIYLMNIIVLLLLYGRDGQHEYVQTINDKIS